MPRNKPATYRKHAVSALIEIHQLSKAGTAIQFDIAADGERLGQIVVGRGSLTWIGRNRRKGIEMSWTRFAEMMDKKYDT